MHGRALAGLLSAALVGGALAGLAHLPPRPPAPPARTPPNVIIIVIDTLRADHLGSYGYERDTSPYIDGLARAGARFATARAPSSWTGASVASLLTGVSPLEHGLEDHGSLLADAHTTMAEVYQRAGFETVGFSANPAFVTPVTGLAQGFDRFDVLHGGAAGDSDALDVNWGDHLMETVVAVAKADHVTDTTLTWLRARSLDEPFFAYVHYFDPHAGYYPPAAFAERFGVGADEFLRGPRQKRFMYLQMRDTSRVTPDQLATLTALYDAEIAFTDQQVGRLLLGVMVERVGPTVVILTSDHGEEFGEHGGLQHSRTLHEELLQIPLIMTGPGIPSGTVIEQPASLMDVWPLLAALTGVPAPAHLPRRSLATFDTDAPAPFFADLAVTWGIHDAAVIDGSTKLIRDRHAGHHLYDLARDPTEQRERAAEAPTKTESLAAALRVRAARTRTSHARKVQAPTVLTPARRAQLEALGYLE